MKSLKNCNCKNIVKSIAVKIAKQEVVAACPFISYFSENSVRLLRSW